MIADYTAKAGPCDKPRVPGRRGRCLPKWHGRGIPERYAELPLEGAVCHSGRPRVLLISLNNSFNDSIIVSMVHK